MIVLLMMVLLQLYLFSGPIFTKSYYMSNFKNEHTYTSKFIESRRDFISKCVFGASVVGSGLLVPPILAKSSAESNSLVLDSRSGATPLWLNYNENSLGMSPSAVEAAQRATRDAGNRYPDAAVERLRELLGEKHGVDPQQIILGNGSTEVIQAIVTVAEGRGARLLEPSPTFGDARRYSKAEGLEIIQVPVGNGFETDIALMKKKAAELAGPLLINICNPNNPTGTIVDPEALVNWIENASNEHIFLLDEAYFDYAQQNKRYASVLPLISAGRENVVIARTFSKIYGMAGMRIGYGIAAPNTAKEVRKFSAGYNLSASGAAAAIASLADDEFYQFSLNSNQRARAALLSTLDELGLEHIESNTNFVLHKISGPLANYAGHMKDNGVYIGRRMTKEDGWNRISIGTPQEMQEFTSVLKEFRLRGWV